LTGSSVDFASRADLRPTSTFFAAGFGRASLAAKVGARASFALDGPLSAELDAVHPRYAVVMFGSNDVQFAPYGGLADYAEDMLAITDAILAENAIPILTSPPPRPLRSSDVAAFGPDGADPWVPRYSAVVRGIAQGRQVPFVDLERELRKIPSLGIGSDKLHLNSAGGGACRFDVASLGFGHNTRNLITLEALVRARAAVEGGTSADAEDGVAWMSGAGTKADPIVVPETPFADLRPLSGSRETEVAGCAGAPPPRYTYRVELPKGAVHFGLFGVRDAKLHVRRAGSSACVPVPDNEGVVPVEAGEHEIIVSAPASSTGEILLSVTP
jgi:hypothetical protein